MNWTGTKVFVTGADGFIGSHLADALVERGANVTAMSLYNSFDAHGWLDDAPMRDHMELVRGDVRDPEQMRTLLKGQEVVFHLAALISVPHSYLAPQSHMETNCVGTMNVLLAAQGDAKRIICTSSSEVYGTAQVIPIDEDHPINPQSPYAASKVAADAVCRSFHLSYQIPVVTLRPFNTYGPRQSERAFVSSAIRQSLDPKVERIRLGDLEPKRDFTYISDTVEAFIAVAGTAGGPVYNAGNGKSVSMGAMMDRIARKAAGGSAKLVIADKLRLRPEDSEVHDLVAGTGKITSETGWAPKVGLTDGIAMTIDWWRDRLDRVRPSASFIK
jgi:nucleoside-diphosphate-sugar epimerase